MNGAPSRVVVAGQDAALWLAANTIHAALAPAGVQVEAVALPSTITVSHVHVTQPALEALHNRLGIAEANLLRATRGSFSLGQRFVGGQVGFFHGYGGHGGAIDGQPFLPFWLKARHHGLEAGFDDFSLTAAAALHGRMLLPDVETERFGRTDYGYHLPAAAYVRSLRALAGQDGIPIHETPTLGIERTEDGSIAALLLDGGRRIAGDFFVDASGEGVIAGGERESWRAAFPADRVLHARGPRMRAVPAYGQVIAAEWGWASLHPSQEQTHVVAAFSGGTAEEKIFDSLPSLCGFVPTEVSLSSSDPGRRRTPWSGNSVAIGPAAARFDPVHGVDLLGVQLGLVHLLSRFPAGSDFAAERHDYNQAAAAIFPRVRDFQAAHYRLARYPGAFWEAARAGESSPELAHRIDTFAARGELALLEQESFPPDSWHALFLGHGLLPESWSPRIDRTEPELMRTEFRRMLAFVKDKVLAQPMHDAYLARQIRPSPR